MFGVYVSQVNGKSMVAVRVRIVMRRKIFLKQVDVLVISDLIIPSYIFVTSNIHPYSLSAGDIDSREAR